MEVINLPGNKIKDGIIKADHQKLQVRKTWKKQKEQNN